jgi:predicted nucleic acid-binding protein
MTDGDFSIYLETNFFIRAVEGEDATSRAPKRLLNVLRNRAEVAITSELTLAETLAPARRAGALPVHIKRRAYRNLLEWGQVVTLIPVSKNILIETADLRARNHMKLPDAIHLVSAIHRRCKYIVSDDRDFDRLPDGMVRVKPDDEGIEILLKALA